MRLVVASTSRRWISMSLGAPRVPAEPWWIMILALGSGQALARGAAAEDHGRRRHPHAYADGGDLASWTCCMTS